MTVTDLTMPTARTSRRDSLPVAIIGAGPIGLAAAANLTERGIPFTVLEAGNSPAAAIRSWGHIRLFSPWRHLIDPSAGRLLEATGWTPPPNLDAAPSGLELVEHYLVPLAELLDSHIDTGSRVTAVSREGMDRTRTAGRSDRPFVLRLSDGRELPARAVIDASGTHSSPNSLGSSGLDPIGLMDVAAHVTRALPDVLGADRHRFSGRHTTVVGAGHSAANTLIALATLIQVSPETRVTWVIRNPRAVRVFTSDDDELAGRASLGDKVQKLIDFGVIDVLESFEIAGLTLEGEPDEGARVRVTGRYDGETMSFDTDTIVNATGFRPDLTMLREIRLDLDPIVEAPRALAPLIDPNVHSCGTVEPHGFAELRHPEPDFFIAGMKSYGRAPTFLLATGYEQVRSIAAYLAGDLAAASSVELVLPATGVCSTTSSATNTTCCS